MLGKYLRRNSFQRVALYYGEGDPGRWAGQIIDISLDSLEIKVAATEVVTGNDIETVVPSAFALPRNADALVAIGGGMAIDVAKYAGFLDREALVIAVPTALSNDGFCSPGASLRVAGQGSAAPPGSRSASCPTQP